MHSKKTLTNVECVLRDSETAVSKSDLRGNITYVNHDYVSVSGYDEEELLGAPQSIVRHPDMPSAVFEDFWATLKAGKVWTGLIKNRSKNGDHYWVSTHAAPIIENHAVTGYASIQVKPAPVDVRAADLAYRAMQGGDRTWILQSGALVRTGFVQRCALLRNVSLKTLLVTASSAFALLFVVMSLLAGAAMGDASSGALSWLMAISVLGIPCAVLAGVLTYRAVIKPLGDARREVERMSSGDLTGTIAARGLAEFSSLMHALRVLQINTKLLVGQIKEATDLVDVSAGEIATGNADLSSRTESQATSLEETASSMEELTSTVKQNAESARHANQLVKSTAEIAQNGGEVAGKVVETMSSIKKSSRKIADIIGVIDSIAFQTNILALNAAVEAARAGEQGRGFAVVASEVRNLAQRSANAAKEIKTLIEDSVSKVEVGGKLVDETGEAMEDIVTSVLLVSDIVRGIAEASVEQSAGIEQVNQAVGQMDEITQQNAALVEQAAAASASMQAQARQLVRLVSGFKLSGATSPSGAAPVGRVMPAGGARTPVAVRDAAARRAAA